MFETTKPTSDADLKNIEQEIVRLNKVITDYKQDQFNSFVASKKKAMVVPRNQVVMPKSDYILGSHSTTYFYPNYDYFDPVYNPEEYPDYSLDSNRTFPILESWKTYKASKATCYILYDTERDYFLYVCIKDANLGNSIVDRS